MSLISSFLITLTAQNPLSYPFSFSHYFLLPLFLASLLLSKNSLSTGNMSLYLFVCFCCRLWGRTGEGNGTPLQCSCLENPMDGGAWWGTVHGVTRSQTRLSDFTFTFHFHALEKEVATHSSVLAWRIRGTGEPGHLLSMGSHRVGHD